MISQYDCYPQHIGRSSVLLELSKIIPMSIDEENDVGSIIRWVKKESDIYRISPPNIPQKHLVVYFILINNDSILLVNHKKAGGWIPTGGHVDVNESLRSTVQREAKEELFIDIDHVLFDRPIMVSSIETSSETLSHTDVIVWYAIDASFLSIQAYDQSEFYDIAWFDRCSAEKISIEKKLPFFFDKLFFYENMYK